MDYLKMIEFLTQELVKRDEAVKQLTDDLKIWKDELDSCSNQLRLCKEDLKEMTIEKDHWKAEALEYRNEVEPEWWSKEEQYKEEIKSRKDMIVLLTKELDRMKKDSEDSWATEFAYNHLKKEYDSIKDYYEERIAKLQVEINHFKNNK